jgi:hypothetical protein
MRAPARPYWCKTLGWRGRWRSSRGSWVCVKEEVCSAGVALVTKMALEGAAGLLVVPASSVRLRTPATNWVGTLSSTRRISIGSHGRTKSLCGDRAEIGRGSSSPGRSTAARAHVSREILDLAPERIEGLRVGKACAREEVGALAPASFVSSAHAVLPRGSEPGQRERRFQQIASRAPLLTLPAHFRRQP